MPGSDSRAKALKALQKKTKSKRGVVASEDEEEESEEEPEEEPEKDGMLFSFPFLKFVFVVIW